MIRYELLRMLRNRKWKYLIPAALLAYIYISGVSSLTVTEGSIYQDQQIQAAACLVSFLFLSIVYQIAWEEEPPLSWQVLLAFPLTCRKSYLCKLCIPVSYTHLRAHETRHDLVCRLLLEKKKKIT